ncbi:hypothetical protein TYM08_P0979 [Marinicellulosiphila megalodicopiae]
MSILLKNNYKISGFLIFLKPERSNKPRKNAEPSLCIIREAKHNEGGVFCVGFNLFCVRPAWA